MDYVFIVRVYFICLTFFPFFLEFNKFVDEKEMVIVGCKVCGVTLGGDSFSINSHFQSDDNRHSQLLKEQQFFQWEEDTLRKNKMESSSDRLRKSDLPSFTTFESTFLPSLEKKAHSAMILHQSLRAGISVNSLDGGLKYLLDKDNGGYTSISHLTSHMVDSLNLSFNQIYHHIHGRDVVLIIDGTNYLSQEHIGVIARFCDDQDSVQQLLISWNIANVACNNITIQDQVRMIQQQYDISDQNLVGIELDRAAYNLKACLQITLTIPTLAPLFCWSHLMDLAIKRVVKECNFFQRFLSAWNQVSSSSVVFHNEWKEEFGVRALYSVATRWWSVILVCEQLLDNQDRLAEFISELIDGGRLDSVSIKKLKELLDDDDINKAVFEEISLIQEIGGHLRDVGLQCETDNILCFDFYDEIKNHVIDFFKIKIWASEKVDPDALTQMSYNLKSLHNEEEKGEEEKEEEEEEKAGKMDEEEGVKENEEEEEEEEIGYDFHHPPLPPDSTEDLKERIMNGCSTYLSERLNNHYLNQIKLLKSLQIFSPKILQMQKNEVNNCISVLPIPDYMKTDMMKNYSSYYTQVSQIAEDELSTQSIIARVTCVTGWTAAIRRLKIIPLSGAAIERSNNHLKTQISKNQASASLNYIRASLYAKYLYLYQKNQS